MKLSRGADGALAAAEITAARSRDHPHWRKFDIMVQPEESDNPALDLLPHYVRMGWNEEGGRPTYSAGTGKRKRKIVE